MIAHLRGQVIHARPGEAILDIGGVGYRVAVSLTTFGTLTQGQEAALHTITVVREDAIHLYGFRDMEERETFMRLVEVSGIGPKLALAILSTLTPQRLARAVEEGAITQLTQVPGIGKKGAGGQAGAGSPAGWVGAFQQHLGARRGEQHHPQRPPLAWWSPVARFTGCSAPGLRPRGLRCCGNRVPPKSRDGRPRLRSGG